MDNRLLSEWVKEAKEIKFAPGFLENHFNKFDDIPPNVLEFGLRYFILLRVSAADIWLRELIADIIATRLVGIAFYLTLKKFLGFFPFSPGGTYPPNYRRFHAVAETLLNTADGLEKDIDIEALCRESPAFKSLLDQVFRDIRSDYKTGDIHQASARAKPNDSASKEEKKEYLEYKALQIIEKVIEGPLQTILTQIKAAFPLSSYRSLRSRTLQGATYLIERIPPVQSLGVEKFALPNWLDVPEALCAAWLAWLGELSNSETVDLWIRRRRTISKLTLRGIELAYFLQRSFDSKKIELTARFARLNTEVQGLVASGQKKDDPFGEGVASRIELLTAMVRRPIEEALVITPILEPDQIGEASIDVRLGNGFIVVRQPRTVSIKVLPDRIEAPGEFHEQISVLYDGNVILHPGQFMLGSTLEYICIPRDMMAYVIGKSSVGRLGLIIATATHVAPGYKGTLTLELSNVGTVPIELHPRVPIAQLVFHRLKRAVDDPYHKRGRFSYSTGPEMPPLSQS